MADKKKHKKNIFSDVPDFTPGGTGSGSPDATPDAPLGGGYTPSPQLANPNQDFTWGGGSLQGYARYYDGDQYAPYNWGDDDISSLQNVLIAGGFLSKKGLRFGVWDPDSASAYKSALTYANRLGISVDELLGQLAAGADIGGGGGGGGGGSLGPAPISDEDITALAQKTAQGVLGRDLRADEIGNFIPAFRGAYQAQETSTSVSAQNIIRKEVAPQGEADAHQVGNVMSVIQKALGG